MSHSHIVNQDSCEDNENAEFFHHFGDPERGSVVGKRAAQKSPLCTYKINPITLFATATLFYLLLQTAIAQIGTPPNNSEQILKTQDTVESMYLVLQRINGEQGTKLENARQRVKEMTRDKAKVESMLNVIKEHEERLVEDNKRLLEELTKTKSELSKVRGVFEVQEKEIEENSVHFENLHEQIDSLKSNKLEVEQLQKEISILREANAMKVSGQDVASEELAKATSQIEELQSKLKSFEEASVVKANEDKANAEASQKILLDQIQTMIGEKNGPSAMIGQNVKTTVKPNPVKAGLPINPMTVVPKSIPLSTTPVIKTNAFAGPGSSKLLNMPSAIPDMPKLTPKLSKFGPQLGTVKPAKINPLLTDLNLPPPLPLVMKKQNSEELSAGVQDENETVQEEGSLEEALEETDVEEGVVEGSGEENEAEEVVGASGEENEVEEVVDESGEENEAEEVVEKLGEENESEEVLEELGEENEAEEVVEELGEESPAEVAELSNEEKLSVRLGDAQKLSNREEMKESLLQIPPAQMKLPEDDDTTVEDLDTMVSKESALLTNDENMVEKLLEQTADTEYDDNEEYDDSESQYEEEEEEEELLEEAEDEERSLIEQPGLKGVVDPSFLEPGLQEIATELTKSEPSNADEYESDGSEPMEIEGEEAEKESEGAYYEETDKEGGEGEYDDYEEEEEFDAEAAKKFVEAGESLEDVGLEEMEENDEILRQTEMQLEDEEEIESEIDSESDETPPF